MRKGKIDWSNKEERLKYYRQYHRDRYSENPDFFKKQTREGNQAVKVEVLTHYGGGKLACSVCSEDRLPCLSIDHSEGRGGEHRRSLRMGSSSQFYRWLRKQGYPDGYTTLCMNCQSMKRYLNSEW